MASYFSGISTALSNTTSKVRQNLLSSDSDGSTVYETATCRALRSYYTEKQRPWPATYDVNRDHESRKGRDIYDPDAIKPAAAPVQAVMAPPSNYGGGYQANRFPWDQQGQQAPPQQQGGQRAGRGQADQRDPRDQRGTAPPARTTPQPQPLPSNRAQSYQNANPSSYSSQPAPPVYMSAKDKLKFGKMGKANQRSDSPSSNPSMGSRGNSYTSSQGGGGYEDSFAPASSGRSGGRSEQPYVGASSPWASGGDDFSGGGYSGGSGYDSGSANTRSNAGARAPGLPSGPRGRRI